MLSWHVFTVRKHPFLVVFLPQHKDMQLELSGDSVGVNVLLCLLVFQDSQFAKGVTCLRTAVIRSSPTATTGSTVKRKWMDLQQLRRSIMYSRQTILLCLLNVK